MYPEVVGINSSILLVGGGNHLGALAISGEDWTNALTCLLNLDLGV